MTRPLIANGKPVRRSQLRALKRKGVPIKPGFAPDTARATGHNLKRPPKGKSR